MAEKQSVLGRVTALAQADVSTLIDDSADPESLFLALTRAYTTTIAEAEEISPDFLDPERIHTPGIFVQRVVAAENTEKHIEQRTVRVRVEA